jgi:hypothetical protein
MTTKITLVLTTPIPILSTDAFGDHWLPALLLEIRNGVALVQFEDCCTVRPLREVRSRVAPTKLLDTRVLLPASFGKAVAQVSAEAFS